MGEKGKGFRLLVGKPEGKKPLGIARRRWVDNINIYLAEIGLGGWGWIWHRVGTVGELLLTR
jgi:hypothetical protein